MFFNARMSRIRSLRWKKKRTKKKKKKRRGCESLVYRATGVTIFLLGKYELNQFYFLFLCLTVYDFDIAQLTIYSILITFKLENLYNCKEELRVHHS